MKTLLITLTSFILGFTTYLGLMEYNDYRQFKNWNKVTFKYRDKIFNMNVTQREQKALSLETKIDNLVRKLMVRPYIGLRCLYFGVGEECPIKKLKFDNKVLKYSVYCWNKEKRIDETMGENLKVLEADNLFKKYSSKRNCAIVLQNPEELE